MFKMIGVVMFSVILVIVVSVFLFIKISPEFGGEISEEKKVVYANSQNYLRGQVCQ